MTSASGGVLGVAEGCALPPAGYICTRGAGHTGPCATKIRYGKWTIDFDPKPIPTRKFDYSFWHDDFDGAPDSYDNRAGTAATVEEAKSEIDMIEDMERDLSADEEAVIDKLVERASLEFDRNVLKRLRAHVGHLIYAIDRGYFGDDAQLQTSAFIAPLREFVDPAALRSAAEAARAGEGK